MRERLIAALAVSALLPAAVGTAGAQAEQIRLHRATFMRQYPLGEIAVIAEATSLAEANRRSYLTYSPTGCIALPARPRAVYVYVNHHLQAAGSIAGFFVARVVGRPGTAQPLVHAYRNDGWHKLGSGPEAGLAALALPPLGRSVSLEDMRRRSAALVEANGAPAAAAAVNALLGGDFHAVRSGAETSSAASSGLFALEAGEASKAWHYLIAFATTPAPWKASGKRPIFYFQPLPSAAAYQVEVVPDAALAGAADLLAEPKTLTIRLGAPC